MDKMDSFEELLEKFLRALREEIKRFPHLLRELIWFLEHHHKRPNGAKIVQIKRGEKMSITGTIPGTTSTFEVDALLNGVQDTAGWPAGTVDTWTCDDPAAVVGPDTGPDVNQPGALDEVTVSIPATDTQGSAPAGSPPSYNLTASVQMPAVGGVTPSPIVVTVNVPIQAAPVPVPTGAAINQIS